MEQTVLVTGGASGIGLAIVEAVLAEGWTAIVSDINAENLEKAKATFAQHGKRLGILQIDVGNEDSVRAAFERCDKEYAPLTGLVNSAGIGREIPALETDTSVFRKILDINLIGSFMTSCEAARRMQTRKSGAIVNIASVSGVRGNAGRVAYGSSKAGMIHMTKILAVELAADGIRVNAIAPGPIETPMVRDMHSAATRKAWADTIPQRRYGEAKDIANAAVFLLDPAKSGYVTGHTLNVDGGFCAAGIFV